jgi:tetratricopeptide (TPR) repeat protein
MFGSRRALKLFYSYAHEDEKLRDKLEKALALLRRQKYIESWHDRKITGGKEWAGQIDENLASADIVLLLISPDFMASDYCSEVELEAAMNRHARRLSRVVPILLRPTDWETSDIAKLNFLPTDAKPITTWPNEDEAFNNVVKGIRRIVDELQQVKPVGLIRVSDADVHVETDTKGTLWMMVRRHWGASLAAVLLLLVVVGVSYAWSKSNTFVAQAQSWLDIGSYTNALANYQLAAGWNPLSPRAKNGIQVSNAALARNDERTFRRAVAELSKSLPNDPYVRVLAGDLAFHDDRAGDALKEYEWAYKARPSFSEAYFRAGVVLLHRGSINDAKDAFERAMNSNPAAAAVPRYSNSLAFCLVKLGRLDEALNLYGKNSNYPLSAIEASRLLLIRGQVRQARDFIQRAVDWLNDKEVATLPDNQGPWEFEAGAEGVRLNQHVEKLCYAQIALSVTQFLLGETKTAKEIVGRAPCAGVVQDVTDIVNADLDSVVKANDKLAKQIQSFRSEILESLN